MVRANLWILASKFKLSYKTKTRYLSSPILSEIFHSPVTASIFSEDKFIETHFNQSGLLLTWAIFSFQPYHVKLSSLQPMEILINSFLFIIQFITNSKMVSFMECLFFEVIHPF